MGWLCLLALDDTGLRRALRRAADAQLGESLK